MVSHRMPRRRGPSFPISQLRCDMSQHMAVEDPIAAPVGSPRECKRVTRTNQLRDRYAPLIIGVNRVSFRVAYAVHAEVEAMQVHRMVRIAGVDDAPVNDFSRAISEPLRM